MTTKTETAQWYAQQIRWYEERDRALTSQQEGKSNERQPEPTPTPADNDAPEPCRRVS